MKKVILIYLFLIISNCVFATDNGEKKSLTLKEAILLALENNIDLKIEETNKDLGDADYIINKAIFIPSLTINAKKIKNSYPNTRLLDGADVRESNNKDIDIDINQKTPWGGNLTLSGNYSKSETNDTFSTVNPYYRSNLSINFNQPLLKNFGNLATKKNIYISRNNLDISKLNFEAKVLNTINMVEDNYWDLVYAYQNLEAKKKSLERSKDFLSQNELKVKVGTSAPIDILGAKAEVASYKSQLISAKQQIQRAEESLKKTLNMSKTNITLVPLDKPEMEKINLKEDELLLHALKNRPDIRSAKLQLKNHKIEVKYAKNQILPELNFKVNYYTVGVGGKQFIYGDKDPFSPNKKIIDIIERSYWDAFDDALKRKYKNYTIGLELKLPLSFAAEKARLAKARINLKKALLNYKSIENNVYAELKEALKNVESSQKLVESNSIRLELEKEKLKAEEQKLSVGLSTNFELLTKQRDFVDAQTNFLQGIINYKKAVSKINKIVTSSLTKYKIVLK